MPKPEVPSPVVALASTTCHPTPATTLVPVGSLTSLIALEERYGHINTIGHSEIPIEPRLVEGVRDQLLVVNPSSYLEDPANWMD